MANNKIPQGYQGTYARAADGSPVLVMVSRSVDLADDGKTAKKEQKPMADKPKEQMSMTDAQPQNRYTPYTTEQKKEYAKQFTPEQIKSYRKGQQSAYAHMGNIGKRNSFFIHDNLKKNEATPPAAPPKTAAKKTPKGK